MAHMTHRAQPFHFYQAGKRVPQDQVAEPAELDATAQTRGVNASFRGLRGSTILNIVRQTKPAIALLVGNMIEAGMLVSVDRPIVNEIKRRRRSIRRTPTQVAAHIAFASCVRSVEDCDYKTIERMGVLEWLAGGKDGVKPEADNWKRSYQQWLVHHCLFDDRDGISLARFDFASDGSQLSPALHKHTTHEIGFFFNYKLGSRVPRQAIVYPDEMNATFLTRGVNDCVAGLRGASIFNVVRATRGPAGELYEAMRDVGVLRISDTTIAAIVNRTHEIRNSWLIESNGLATADLSAPTTATSPRSSAEASRRGTKEVVRRASRA